MQVASHRSLRLTAAAILSLWFCGSVQAQAPKPAPKSAPTPATGVAAFVKVCKDATALVNVHEHGTGSAFCVSNDGIFLTNRHVVESLDVGESVDLVLHAGEKTERVLKAKVVHISNEDIVDLAILKTAPVKDIPTLKLGEDSRLEETAAVTAFGFPFGRSLAGGKQQFPNVTVTSGKISALRRQSGELAAIQVDAAVNPGCSGGPLVDKQGKVIGIIFGVVPLSGIAFAVPISKAREYLNTPRVVLSHPEIRYSNRHERQPLEIEVVELTSSTKPTTVELTLESEDGKPRKLPVVKKGTQFEVQTELFTKPATPGMLRLTVWQGASVFEARVADQPLRFGASTLPMSACALIQRRDGTHVVTTVEREKFAATLINLPKAKPINGAGQLDLALMDRVQVFVEDSSEAEVTYDVKASRGGEVIATTAGSIRCSGSPRRATEEYPEEEDPDAVPLKGLTIEAAVDGKSSLMVTPDGLYWEHHEHGLPGTPEGTRSFVLVNGRKWHLHWQINPDGTATSETLPLKVGGLSHDARLLSLRDSSQGPHNPKRGGTKFEEHPLGAQPSRITFDDHAVGAGLYNVRLTPKVKIPVPASVTDRLKKPTSSHWSFDSDAPDTIRDMTGNGHVGRGPVAKVIDGPVGKAMAFDGSSVNCGNIGDFERTDAFSMGGWVYTTRFDYAHEICGRMEPKKFRGHDLMVIKDRLVFHLIHDFGAGNGIKVVSADPIKPFQWHHYFATYNGNGNSSGTRLYIDGTPVECAVEMDNLTETPSTDVPFRIGMREPGSLLENLRGQLDEIRLYARELDPQEVRELARSKEPGQVREELKSLREKLAGVWSFDELRQGKQIVVQDGSGLDHHGTVEFVEQNIEFETGRFGKAVRLNNRVIQFGSATGDFERTDAFSYGAWINRTDRPVQSLISKLEQRPPYRGFDLMVHNGQPRTGLTSVWDGGQDEPQRSLAIVGQETVPPNEWHHLIVTYDGSSKAAGVTIYLDGRAVPLKVEHDNLDGTIRTVAPLCLGNRFNDTRGVYDGLLDEAVIFARCLTAEEVSNLVAGKPVKP